MNYNTWSDDCKKQLSIAILKNKNKDGSDINKEQSTCVQNKITTHWKNYGEFVKDYQNSTQFIMDSINQCKKSNSIIKIIVLITLSILILLGIGIGYYFEKKHKCKIEY